MSINFDENQPIDLLTSLSRARNNVPLSLRIRASGSTAALVMDIIMPHIHRWQRIHFILPVAELARLHMHHCPILEQLTLCVFEKEWHMTNPITNPTVIRSAPLLSYADARAFPNLDFTGHPLELPSLCLLKVTDDQMLPFLTTPNLERLELQYTSRDEDVMGIPGDALGSFLTRSGCDLRFLSINTKEIPRKWHIADLLRSATSVRHLSVTVADSWDFMYLMRTISSSNVLPRVVHFEVRDPGAVIDTKMEQYRAMLEMLPLRREHTALEKMELFLGRRSVGGPRTPPAAVVQELRGLVEEEGLQVRITARSRPTSSYDDVRLFDNFDGNTVEYTYIPAFEV
ncbi:hypothetical protein C8F04DRAFT_1195001 [Mycena alexandri]|uniref:F-box domain-containing protein n=1 Tax=Mycena alexandri TaxID=1745969 RepID=A0AAD6S7I1_9AGAR|nr:hypothetical protein C8F04DRAFT_1195001 [Mycena alexandri]